MSYSPYLKMSIPALAALVKHDRSWVYRVIELEASCGKGLAKAIEAATDGDIRASWLLGLEPAPHHTSSPLDTAV